MIEDWPVERDDVYLCWLWCSQIAPDGYGIYASKGKRRQAHRHVYKVEVGSVPRDKVLDHMCRRRNCVNPEHLEPVSASVNERRKIWRNIAKLKKCKNGHDYYRHGRRTPEGGKVCMLCG